MPVHSYTLSTLLSLRESEAAKRWPADLSTEFKNEEGVWDPHRAFNMAVGGGSSGSASSSTNFQMGGTNRENAKSGGNFSREHKQSVSERMQDADSLVLGPQKQRSWTEGCHVTSSNSTHPSAKRGGDEGSHTSTNRGRGRGNYNHPRGGAPGQQANTDSSAVSNSTSSTRFSNLSTNSRNYRGASNGGSGGRGGGSNASGTGFYNKNAYARSFSNSGGGGSNYGYGSRSDNRTFSQSDDPEWFVNAPSNFADFIDLEGIRDDDTSMLEYKLHKQADSLSTRESRNASASNALNSRLLIELEGFPEESLSEVSSRNSKEPSLSSPLKMLSLNSSDVTSPANTDLLKQSLQVHLEKSQPSAVSPFEDPIRKLQQALQSDPSLSMEAETSSKKAPKMPALIPGVMSVDELENELKSVSQGGFTEPNKDRAPPKMDEKLSGMGILLSNPPSTTNLHDGQQRDLDAKLLGLILGNKNSSTSSAAATVAPHIPAAAQARPPNTAQHAPLSSPSKEAMENMLRNLLLKPSGSVSQANNELPGSIKSAPSNVPPSPVSTNKVLTVEELEADWLRNTSDGGRALSSNPLSKLDRPSASRKEGVDVAPNAAMHDPFIQQQLPPYEKHHIASDNAPLSAAPQFAGMNASAAGSQVHPPGPFTSQTLQQAILTNLLRQAQATNQPPHIRMANLLAAQNAPGLIKRPDPLSVGATSEGPVANQFPYPMANSVPFLVQQHTQSLASKRPLLASPSASASLVSALCAGMDGGTVSTSPMTIPVSSSRENEHALDLLMRAIRKGSSTLPTSTTANGNENATPTDNMGGLFMAPQQQSTGDVNTSLQKQGLTNATSQLQAVRPPLKPVPTTSMSASSPATLGHRLQPSTNSASQSLLQHLNQMANDGSVSGSRISSSQGSAFMQVAPPSYNPSPAMNPTNSRPIVKQFGGSATVNDSFSKTVDSQMLASAAAPYGAATVGFRPPLLLAPTIASKSGNLLGSAGLHVPFRGAVDISHLNLAPQRHYLTSQQQPFRVQEQLMTRGAAMVVPVSQYILPSMSIPPPGWPFSDKVGSGSASSMIVGAQPDVSVPRIRTVNEIEAEALAKHFHLASPKGAASNSMEGE